MMSPAATSTVSPYMQIYIAVESILRGSSDSMNILSSHLLMRERAHRN